jgi:hypothetical protein
MNPTTYAEAAALIVASIGSLLILKREKKKYGTGILAKTAHTTSRYRMLWLLAYAIAIPSALVLHILHLLERIYISIGRTTTNAITKTAYITIGITIWIVIAIIRLVKHIGQKTWEWLA